MAVVVQYVVVREGVEKMTFTSKKEADAYDKMLDIADNLIPFLQQAEIEIAESESEKLAFYMANHKDELLSLLKGGSVATKPAAAAPKKSARKAAAAEDKA
ncbi:YebG family protein [Shewanella submarina]|uniref:YebG family protein n=1 Tax=Shewanella submarina TaxID=2016376 RepID=A0ABV7GFZ2_9GAMM|nr:YebG family protein [Shewanella submarina]MCL1037522.1 YebG family protein [Shewanella submarina]